MTACFRSPGDSLFHSNGMEFSTSDNDNDAWSGDCVAFRGGGGNWWKHCGDHNINGRYGGDGDSGYPFMNWFYFEYDWQALKSMTLMFRPAV